MSGTVRRLKAFFAERAPARVYVTYAVLWVLALEGALALVEPGDARWRLGVPTLAEIGTVWLALLFIRVVDEQKDLAYDREHNPGRPLPRGSITVRELRLAMAVIAAAGIALTVWRSPLLTGWLLLDLVYICFLVGLERWSRAVRDGIFRNLAVSYPVQALLSVHVWLSYRDATGAGPHWSAAVPVLLCACVFLHFEFARKTSHQVTPGATLYSNAIGTRGSVGLTVGCALAAAVLALFVVRPWQVHGPAAAAAWLPLSALGCIWAGGERFALADARGATWPRGPAMGFLAWSYVGLFVAALSVADPGLTV